MWREKFSRVQELADSGQGFLDGGVEIIIHDNGIKGVPLLQFAVGAGESAGKRLLVFRAASFQSLAALCL